MYFDQSKHTICEMRGGTLQEQIDAWREVATKAHLATSTLTLIRDAFPDAVDTGGEFHEARWLSKSAHDIADGIDVERAYGKKSYCLYFAFPGENVRVYSGRPVNLVMALDLLQSGDRRPLLEILKSTTEGVEEEDRLADLERAKRKEQEAKRAREEEIARAKRVVILNPAIQFQNVKLDGVEGEVAVAACFERALSGTFEGFGGGQGPRVAHRPSITLDIQPARYSALRPIQSLRHCKP